MFKSLSNQKLLNKKSHTITYGHVFDFETGLIIDEVLVMLMKAPNTYTRQDVVEFNCHGGYFVVKKVLEILLNNGARLAEPGEFTKRGFLNGRIDLSQAEGVIDLIHSQTELSRQAAINQIDGKLKKQVKLMRSEVIDMIATIEAAIDYPEHDVEEETYTQMEKNIKTLIFRIERFLEFSEQGKIIREGITTAILGKPNVGKSSLLNFLLDEERAIVTEFAGTTRDTVEETINLSGIPIKIVDTAGIRNTDDYVEKIGVEKSKNIAEKSDLILMMFDSSKELDKDDKEILEFIKAKKCIFLLNKIDLASNMKKEDLFSFTAEENIISISVKHAIGIDDVIKRIKVLFFGGEVRINEENLLGNTRHRNALFKAKEALDRALTTTMTKMPEDFISMDLLESNNALGEITGDTIDEEIIDRIFTKFCLGK